jgi:hypothetical protein
MDGRMAALAQPGSARNPRQLFVTASATLKDQVAKAFRRLQVRIQLKRCLFFAALA